MSSHIVRTIPISRPDRRQMMPYYNTIWMSAHIWTLAGSARFACQGESLVSVSCTSQLCAQEAQDFGSRDLALKPQQFVDLFMAPSGDTHHTCP